ncbi:hypothetical protein [Sphingomonas sp. KC8]|uniref:hypothetical protein n=1 Tax=Sphingomonas sp. KC8 TaxID=1030157 RepID=UPI0002489399|nr:hypothetical protein [Sphingomonas sp. KC8]ARS29056.1 hypothetical protein KC8_17440 [Sphingomonas sp. KC8]
MSEIEELRLAVRAQAQMIGELLAWISNDDLNCTLDEAQDFLQLHTEQLPPEARRRYFAEAYSLHHMSATGERLPQP